MSIIEDGTGSGFVAKVDNTNRLNIRSLQINSTLHAALLGDSFCITSGIVTLTNTTCNALLYILSCETTDIVLSSLFLDFGDAACATASSGTLKLYFNPTGGTLIDDGCLATVVNERIGDSHILDASAFKPSAVSKTLTGGSVLTYPISSVSTNIEIKEEIIIPKGKAFGISYSPPAGNTSQPVHVGFRISTDIISGD